MADKFYLNQVQFNAEISRCLNCKNQPCMKACPVGCNPHEFIQYAKNNDFENAVKIICNANPMGQTCGLVCPDKFCMKACTRANIDFPINIPRVQATILEKHRNNNKKSDIAYNNKQIAVIGAGPAGMAAAEKLAKNGFRVAIFEASDKIGGALNMIPDNRLPFEVIKKDWDFIAQNKLISLHLNAFIDNPEHLLQKGFCAVIVASGEPNCIDLGIEGEEFSISYLDYLKTPEKYISSGNIAIVGGGAVATDCAVTARTNGGNNVEMFIRRRVCDMRITEEERKSLIKNNIDLTTMTKIKKITKENDKLILYTCKTHFVNGKLEEIEGTTIKRPNFDILIKAIGSSAPKCADSENIFYAGDCKNGGSTVVEAVASGKDVAQKIIEKF